MPSDIETDLEIIRDKIRSLMVGVIKEDERLWELLFTAEARVEEALAYAKRRN